MKLLVAGASGFIGINFILAAPRNWEIIATYNKSTQLKKLVEKNNLKNVRLVKCNLLKQKNVKKLARIVGQQPINVLYLAGNSDPQLSFSHPLIDLQENTIALLNLLESINVDKIVYFSSGSVYDGIKGKVSPETKIDPKLPYAISKLASEQYIKYYYHKKGKVKKYVIVRFFGAYGPFEPKRKIYTKLVKAFYFDKQNTFQIYDDGKNLIDAVYIDEVVKAIIKILKSKTVNVVIDLCHARPMSINKLVKKAAQIFGVKNVKIKHAGKSAEPIFFRPSQKGLKKHFGITLKDNLTQSLKKLARHLAH